MFRNRDDLSGTPPNIQSSQQSDQNVVINIDNSFNNNRETSLPDTILIPLCDVLDMWQYHQIIFVKVCHVIYLLYHVTFLICHVMLSY